MRFPFIKEVSWYLVFAMFLIGIAPKSEAGFAPSQAIAHGEVDRVSDMGKIQEILEAKMIRERLAKLGFTAEEITNRLSQLSDQQVHQLALNLDELKAGDDGLGIIIALLVIAILVVLLIQLTGHKVVITK